MDYRKNVEIIKQNIKKACQAAGRDEAQVILVAAVKTQPSTIVAEIKDFLPHIGENRVQEFLARYDADPNIKWHFIGQLQTNKVKYLTGKNVLIHSLDRIELAAELEKQGKKSGTIFECLIEVNIGDEYSKGGISTANCIEFIRSLESYENIKILGVMSVLPYVHGEELENYYKELQSLYAQAAKINQKNFDCKYLSAGMSGDYEVAIKYGANIVRIGSVIFGERQY